ncbi:MAG: nucleoside triphosphate pyrophosphohydrolase [Candidatus Omnitrophica bacterium]|nr:nucleoside triphosphate pyrophosphohydrolase [Candidatus Omnitrophota bacterium]
MKDSLQQLISIIRHLRGPRGCPWDRRQSLRSMCGPLIEEAYEIIEAIRDRKRKLLAEELGDLVCVALMMITIGEEKSFWKRGAVFERAAAKMRRRHPHVFGTKRAKSANEALRVWHRAKLSEKSAGKPSILHGRGLRRSFPAMLEAEKIQSIVSREGFEWDNLYDALDKAEEELRELRRECRQARRDRIESEIGDLLFAIVSFARKVGLSPEFALHRANDKFCRRFKIMEEDLERRGKSLASMRLPELVRFWEKTKRREK